MLSQELEFSLNSAFQFARERRHEFITVEHLLTALLDNPSAARVLRACGGNLDELRRSLTAFLEDNIPTLPAASKIGDRHEYCKFFTPNPGTHVGASSCDLLQVLRDFL